MIKINVIYSLTNELRWRLYGELVYNHPKCCVDYYIYNHTSKPKEWWSELIKSGKEPWAGTGFIPCEECRKKIYGKSRKEAEKILGFKFTNYNQKELKDIEVKSTIVEKMISELKSIKNKTLI